MSAARHLHVAEDLIGEVDPVTGELHTDQASLEHALRAAHGELQAKDHELDELIRKFKGQSRELGELRRDRDREAREHEAWPTLVKLHKYWRQQTGHTRVTFTPASFWVALPQLKNWGLGNLAAGVAGIAHDPNRRQLKNGKWETYDDWETLMRNQGNVRRYIGRRPEGWELPGELAEEPGKGERPAG